MGLRARWLFPALGCLALAGQAPPPGPPVPRLLPGESLAISGSDGVVHPFGEARGERPLGPLATLAWTAFEGGEWAAQDVRFRCKPAPGAPPCGGPKGHGRLDLESALRTQCGLAFRVWITDSAGDWRRIYGDGVARLRLEEGFAPFLGDRLGRGEGLPALDAAWLGEGDLLRITPERLLAWLNDPQQARLLSLCRRTLGSRAFHFKDLTNTEDWWFFAGEPKGASGLWVVGGNGSVLAVLHQPAGRTAAEGLARFQALMGNKTK
jgi:hypothetical protein